jgi:hypothetical protein
VRAFFQRNFLATSSQPAAPIMSIKRLMYISVITVNSTGVQAAILGLDTIFKGNID